ncbi:HEPN domain-containing protein [uncultured Thiodictyon sp.]|uniref:HEPN domain-containing protein n=1 Tax=uncultured Thiodictyon sp. TaxID=1846217 RepID=UPI0025F16A49|nr:HEPN domain-containing protein [uncultured Thiodictyon sp.]
MNAARDDAERLLRRARANLKALRHMGDEDCFDDNIYGFHAQQAAEKSLKAWLACLGHP